MHNQITASTGMDQESHLAPDHHTTYANENWIDMNSFQHHQTTMPDYGSSFGFMPSITHGLPSERMPPPPPPQQPLHQSPATHTQLPALLMPHHTLWPSMLSNPNPNYGPPHSAPPVAIPSITAPLKTSKLPAIQTTSQPRKTLTDDDRRKMCQYAEDHPTAKQTDIGAKFGVERSTVSKVLRNKDKYLNSEERSSSPVKRNGKGKGASVEKALQSYLRKAQRAGTPISTESFLETAQRFSSATGDSIHEPANAAWLEKFMLKNGMAPGRLIRRASETNITDSMRASGSPMLAPSQPQSALSPASPSGGHLSQSPLSANKTDEEKEGGMNGFLDFSSDGAYKHSSSQNASSLPGAFTTDTATPSFPGSAISPTSSFNFSPDPNVGAFLVGDRNAPMGHPNAAFQRPRSQTFPTLDLGYMDSAEPATPKYHVPSTAPSSALDSSSSETAGPHFSFEHAVSSPPRLRHSSSSGSIAGRSVTTPVTTSAVASAPGSPTQEDARRAADTLLCFIAANAGGGFADQNEYHTIARLVEKLRIHQSQIAKAAAAAHGMGGLSRIPEGDSEMGNSAPVSAAAAMLKLEPIP